MEPEAPVKGEWQDPDESPNQKQLRERIERLEAELATIRIKLQAIEQRSGQH